MADESVELSPPPRPWEAPGWAEETAAWVMDRLAQAGMRVRGALQPVQTRPWSAVWQIETSDGRAFFKAAAPQLAYEAGLHAALAASQPRSVPRLIGVDVGRAWILMADCGPTLRTRLGGAADLGLWAEALADFADLQTVWAGRSDQLLEIGLLDRRLATLPDLLAALLEDATGLRLGEDGGLTRNEHRRLMGSLPRWRAICDRLGDLGLPETLHHDDLHDANVYPGEGGSVFGDWGEACVAVPLLTPMIGLRSLGWRLGLDDDSPDLAGIRRGYLAHWFDGASSAEANAAYELSLPLGALSRALTWNRAQQGIPYRLRGDDATASAEWLRQALEWLDRLPEPGRPIED